MFVCCECRVLSGRGLCDELITYPEESYRLWCVIVCDLENFKNEEAMTRVGSQRHRKKNFNMKCMDAGRTDEPSACSWDIRVFRPQNKKLPPLYHAELSD